MWSIKDSIPALAISTCKGKVTVFVSESHSGSWVVLVWLLAGSLCCVFGQDTKINFCFFSTQPTLFAAGNCYGHVTRSNFSCNLQCNKHCVASCKKKFTCNTPFCNCNCCVASCKKSRTTLYFSQRCEPSCLRVTSPLQLATQFCQNGPIRAQDVGDLACPSSCLLLYALQVVKKVENVWHPLCNLKGFLFIIVALQVGRRIASGNMAGDYPEMSRIASRGSNNTPTFDLWHRHQDWVSSF